MFETAVVRADDHRRFSLLSFSLAAHSVAIAAGIAASVASIRLPEQAPRQMTSFYRSAPPPAFGEQRATPAAKAPAAIRHAPPVAPTVIPDTPAATPSSDASESQRGEADATPGLPSGTPGAIGTQASTAVVAAPDAAGPLPIANGVKAPIVIRRVEPIYPPLPLRAHMSGTVVLQCVIDKSGRVRDVRVVSSTFAAFEQPAIDAVQQWQFTPGTLNERPVDTIFELTVKFQVK